MEGGFQVVDVRSPAEFADGHMPGAVNFPLLGDAERAPVGIAYKTKGAARARLAAMELVSPGLPEYLGALARLARSQPRGRRLAHHVLAGRRAQPQRSSAAGARGRPRRHCRRGLPGLPPGGAERTGRVAGARAGVHALRAHRGGQERADQGAGRAGARGGSSARGRPTLGGRPRGARAPSGIAARRAEPTGRAAQKDFDALLWDRLRRPEGDYLVLEGEGGKIGRIFVPASVADAIRTGLPVLVTAPVEVRAERIMREYAPESWDDVDRDRFLRSLRLIAARLPRETVVSLERAFADGRFTDVVGELLDRLLRSAVSTVVCRREGDSSSSSRPPPTPARRAPFRSRHGAPDARGVTEAFVPDIGNTLREARIRRGLTHHRRRERHQDPLQVPRGPGGERLRGASRSHGGQGVSAHLRRLPEARPRGRSSPSIGASYEQPRGRTRAPSAPRWPSSRARGRAPSARRSGRGAPSGATWRRACIAIVAVILLAWFGSGRRAGAGHYRRGAICQLHVDLRAPPRRPRSAWTSTTHLLDHPPRVHLDHLGRWCRRPRERT